MKKFIKPFKSSSQVEEKVMQLKLKASKKSASLSASKSQSNFRVSVGKNGTQINNKSIVIKSNVSTVGFDYKSGKTNSSQDIGSTAASSLNYIDRDSANELNDNDELSNTYTMDKQLSKDELEDVKNDLKENGVEGLRRDIISLNHDKELDKDDHVEIVRNAVHRFKEETGKEFNSYMSFHTNTEHKHVHLNSTGSKDDVKFTKEQLQHFKVIVAQESAKKLDEKQLGHKLDRYIEKEEKTLENHRKLEKVMNNSKEENKNLINDRNNKLEKAFGKYSNNIEFSKDEIKQLQQIQKTSGYVQHLEKNPTKENQTKLEKAKEWESNLKSKLSIETQDKFEHLQKKIEQFKDSPEAKQINGEFLVKQSNLINKTASEAGELGFKKTEETLQNKANNLSTDKLKNISKDKALEIKEHEVNNDKHLTLEQEFDKAIDGKLDNKMNGLQH